MWNDFKVKVLPHSLIFVLLFFIIYAIILVFQYIKAQNAKEKLYFGIYILVMLIGIVQFNVPIICDGEADLSKHLFLFNVCFDIMFIYLVVWLVERLTALCKKVRKSQMRIEDILPLFENSFENKINTAIVVPRNKQKKFPYELKIGELFLKYFIRFICSIY